MLAASTAHSHASRIAKMMSTRPACQRPPLRHPLHTSPSLPSQPQRYRQLLQHPRARQQDLPCGQCDSQWQQNPGLLEGPLHQRAGQLGRQVGQERQTHRSLILRLWRYARCIFCRDREGCTGPQEPECSVGSSARTLCSQCCLVLAGGMLCPPSSYAGVSRLQLAIPDGACVNQ